MDSWLEDELECELHLTSRCGRADDTEVRIIVWARGAGGGERCARGAVVDMVEGVEGFYAELKRSALRKRRGLEDGDIELFSAGSAIIGQRAWDVAEGITGNVRRIAEGGSVEPFGFAAVGQDRALAGRKVWTGCVRVITIATDRQWKACLEDGDGVDLISTDQSIDESVA